MITMYDLKALMEQYNEELRMVKAKIEVVSSLIKMEEEKEYVLSNSNEQENSDEEVEETVFPEVEQ